MMTDSPDQANPTVVPVIPMKPLAECKTRLTRVMGNDDRADLTMGMFRRVLLAIRGAGVDPFWVVGGDDRIRNMARTLGANWMEDLGRNLNDTITKSFESARMRGVSALYLPGDLPFIKPGDIHQLIRSAEHQHNITLSPARRGRRDQRDPGSLRSHTIFSPGTGQQQFPQARGHCGAHGRFRGLLLQPGYGIRPGRRVRHRRVRTHGTGPAHASVGP